MADQREDLYALCRNENGQLSVRLPPWTAMDIINRQLYAMKARNVLPTGISLSMNLVVCSSLVPYLTHSDRNEQKLLGIPLTVIGDKDDIIAWSIDL